MDWNSQQEKSVSPIKRALKALDDMQAKLDAIEYARREPIAIIGMGCRFPGGADNPEAFWRLLRDGVDAITEVPPQRWDMEKYYDPDPDTPGKISTRYGGFLDRVDAFDAQFFGIPVREATSLDPQQRLLLEVSWEALENANQAPDRLFNSLTGVFVGISSGDYSSVLLGTGEPTDIDAYYGTGNSHSVAAGRISYSLGLKGPSFAVDAVCSSSLVAVHLACQSLRLQECSLALAGGVNLLLAPENSINLSKARMLAPDGRCKTFDASADGYTRGEGCGVIVLKRLSDAIANGDRILATIRGSAVSHNGRSSSLVAHSGPSQQAVIGKALENAGIEPTRVSYVEVNGTGTSLVEPVEVGALGAVFGKNRPQEQPLVIGSVKTNIGHLEAAAGIASLIKVVLALQHKEIPPHLHFKQPNPYIPWNELPVKVPTNCLPWSVGEKLLLAGVSSFGFSGTNAHVVLEEAPVAEPVPRSIERPLHLLTLSAKTDEALVQLAERYEKHLAANPDLAIGDICFSANSGRSHFQHRLSVLASSTAELCDKLAAFSAGQGAAGLFKGTVTDPPKIAFLFGGQGSQYIGMGRQLYETQPTFRAALDKCAEILHSYLEKPLLEVLYPTQVKENTQYAVLPKAVPGACGGFAKIEQAALFALEYALFQLWKSWGIKPAAVMGYGVGEYVAATVAGVFGLEDGLKLLMESSSGELERIAKEITYSQSRISLVSLTGELATAQIATPQYWCDCSPGNAKGDRVRQSVNAINIDALAQQGYEILVEVAPKPMLAQKTGKVCLSSLNPGKDDWQQLLESLGTLYVRGAKVDWLGFERDYSRQSVQLPTYPWQRKRYWFEPNNNGHGNQNNGQHSMANLLAQAESEQLIRQLEMTGELSKEELNLLPKLLRLLAKQYQQQTEASRFIEPTTPAQPLDPKSLTAEDIQAWLVDRIAQELGVKPDDVNVRVPFDSYGLDSVLALGIASAGKQFLGLDLSPLLLVHYPTIESLSHHLAKELEASELEIFEI
ncbi:MAG: acyltransferase domain-containing protein [Hydrococcus sp. C42_A2020_068]|nr:acyltransferase domain-containing protein [Hydrococcus sp. C42_A2020_068]